MDFPLFTSPFFRENYCLYPLWNNSCSKNCLGCKKPHGFVEYRIKLHTEWDHPPKKWKIVFGFWRSLAAAVTHAVTHLSSDGVEIGDRLFGQDFFLYTSICVLWGECGFIYMISICITPHISVWLLINSLRKITFFKVYSSDLKYKLMWLSIHYFSGLLQDLMYFYMKI